MDIDIGKLIPADEIEGEDEEDRELLLEMRNGAVKYLKSFHWCPKISELYFGFGVGKIVAVFLAHLEKKINETDDWLWVIDGDLPSAYLVTDCAKDALTALSVYCDLMEGWAEAVMEKTSLDNVYPVEAPATIENAEMLKNRVLFIREKIL